ncbi:hypothetical protein CIHG_08807 [Coccidioides immitis H538.4]|uniref:Uncharacterized protein n=1 Tax=Coccidioides immitis H538.4 TaxID=396776 RepID=A0A0J8S290_COCIT|nr:hypothetical protein CIHG_08807 [Coccidioides immitis H538.4]
MHTRRREVDQDAFRQKRTQGVELEEQRDDREFKRSRANSEVRLMESKRSLCCCSVVRWAKGSFEGGGGRGAEEQDVCTYTKVEEGGREEHEKKVDDGKDKEYSEETGELRMSITEEEERRGKEEEEAEREEEEEE